MARKFSVTRTALAGGVAALGVTALASGLIMSPAQADDADTTTDNTTTNPQLPGDMDGDHGMGGGHHGMNQLGQPVWSERTIVQADGTTVIERMASGTVSAVSADSITISTEDGKSFTYSITSTTVVEREHATAAIADVVVGDFAHVRGTVSGDTATATDVHAESAATHAAEEAARAAGTAPDNDGDGPHGNGEGRGHGGPGGHGGKGGRGHGGPRGHGGMMNDGTESSVVKQADGTFITVVRTSGTVSAVGSDSITIALSDGTSKTITIPSTATIDRDHATATLADIAVGDHVRIEGTETDGTLTVTEVRARSAAEVAAHQAQTAPSTSTATNASFSGKGSLKVKKTALAVARTAKA